MKNLNINLVIAEFNETQNAVKEFRVKTVHSIEKAEKWLANKSKPAMFYLDGMQNHDRFLDLCCCYNSKYWAEYKKVID